MRAAQITRFGEPEVLRIAAVDQPIPSAGEVLVAVEAASVNGHDTLVRSGALKMASGRRFPIGVGLDFAGAVAAIGADVRGLHTGERVWGTVHPRQRHRTGAMAEYVLVPADRVALAPEDLSAADAASLVVAGTTALIALRDTVHLARGERILVRGAAGGVGTAAAQLARAMGGRITALARERHADALLNLGADQVVDYTALSSPDHLGLFDVIFDTVGTELNQYRSRLDKGGRMVTIGLSGPAIAAIAASSVHGSRRIRAFSANPDADLLRDLAGYVASDQLRPVVDNVYPLSDIAAAHRAFEKGGVLGKHVVSMAATR